ncbi:hypothetical protein AB0C28_53885 [Nonomuraea sp. NPDC048892]|uniref:hypothetical protein n=1 Tax=Nonomuraea sp. NPDC048892 TaxID=3154624 RepID=UPI0033C0AD37
MKFRLIHAEKDHHEVSLLARVLGVSRQGYYAWAARQRRGPSARARQDQVLTAQTRTAPGNAAPTRTPTAYFANTSPREPT